MERVKRKETNGNIRQYLMISKERDEEAADERDLVSSLPIDLITEIFVKLPAKSIAKLIFVSKLWSSILREKDFIDLFISRSLTRPSFLFSFGTPSFQRFDTLSQEEPSSSNGNKTSITWNLFFGLSTPVRGLICGQEIGDIASKVICNPSTGQFVTLPKFKTIRRRQRYDILHFLGYDPINDVYKVLGMTRQTVSSTYTYVSEEHQVFTLGAKKKAWRKIQCKYPHYPVTRELCRDGVVYYGAWNNSFGEESLIVSFDVRDEDFGVIKLPEGVKIESYGITELVNYHEKIALADRSYTGNFYMWVLEDVKKQEWSKISFLLSVIDGIRSNLFYCRGTISTGEIIFARIFDTNPYFLVYYDPKGNNCRRVDIEGVRFGGPITLFLDHVENPMFLQKEV